MERIGHSPRPFKEGKKVLFPGPDHWEIWTAAPPALKPLQESVALETAAPHLGKDSQIALPAHEAIVVPLWLGASDPSLFRDMTDLQLEKRGLLASGFESTAPLYTLETVVQDGDETLVTAALLADGTPAALCQDRVRDYLLAIDLLPLPPNHCTIWRELNRWVFCLTRNGKAVSLQSLPSQAEWADLLQEIRLTLLELELEKVIFSLEGAVCWHPIREEDQLHWRNQISLPLEVAPRLPLALQSWRHPLVPLPVQASRSLERERHRSKRWLGAALAVYLVLLALLLGHCGILLWQRHSLRNTLAATHPKAEHLRQISDRWNALEDAIDPGHYPLELFYRCTRGLPAEGVRYVAYSLEDSDLLLQGEASNAALAFSYLEALKQNRDLAAYSWAMASPKLLPNNSAQFQITGTSRYAPPHRP